MLSKELTLLYAYDAMNMCETSGPVTTGSPNKDQQTRITPSVYRDTVYVLIRDSRKTLKVISKVFCGNRLSASGLVGL